MKVNVHTFQKLALNIYVIGVTSWPHFPDTHWT
jgi:hypothetical protein